MNIEILVNKENLLSENYIPSNLIITDENENNFHNYVNPNLKPTICSEIYPYFLSMKQDMEKESLYIIVDSGYRSYSYQQQVWDNGVMTKGLEHTRRYIAPPGGSEHQTGLAVDIATIKNGQYNDDIKEDDKEVLWLLENSYKYGFILRYPKGKEDITGYNYEPWHFRFVGTRLAHILKENDITLEEYYLKKDYYDNNKIKKL